MKLSQDSPRVPIYFLLIIQLKIVFGTYLARWALGFGGLQRWLAASHCFQSFVDAVIVALGRNVERTQPVNLTM